MHVRRTEQILIRMMILASVALAIVQLGLAKDPVDFYLAMAAKVENPPLDIPAMGNEASQTYTLALKAVPNAAVKVWQNGVQLTDLSEGEKLIKVRAGEIILDGRGIGQSIRVQILPRDANLKEPHSSVLSLNGNTQNVKVGP